MMVVAALFVAALPLLWPAIPPLTDLPGHIGRYHVMLAGPDAPTAAWYHFEWRLVPNLAGDLLVAALAPAIGLLPAAKLVAVGTPVLTVAAALWLSREVHGRISPTAFLALPLAYNQAFLAGFVNYALAMAGALAGLALWLRLERLGKRRLRAALMVPVGALLWVMHAYGWAVLALTTFAVELHRRRGRGFVRAISGAALSCVPLALPLLLMLAWRSGSGGLTHGFLEADTKLLALATVLRDRWAAWDLACLGALGFGTYVAVRRGWVTAAPALLWCALALAIAFLALPKWLFGSALADARLAPYAILLALMALRPRADAAKGVGIAILVFVLLRMAGLALSMALYDADYRDELRALAHLPENVRLASLVSPGCDRHWADSRLDHLGGLALARRNAFSNEQWALAGAPLVRITPPVGAGAFAADPSQFLRCEPDQVAKGLGRIPRTAFDYVWVIAADGPPPRASAGMERIWAQGNSALYRTSEAATAASRS